MSARDFVMLALLIARTAFLYMVVAAAISACALAPNSIRPELVHQSHLTQHEPFTSHPTDYGTDDVDLVAHWGRSSGTFLEIGEGISLNHEWSNGQGYGEVWGPREFFVARFGYAFELKR